MDVELFQAIANQITETAFDPSRWTEALAVLAGASRAVGAVILPIRGRIPDLAMSPEIAGLASEYFRGDWYRHDLRDRGIPKLLRTGIMVDQDFTTPDEMRTHPYYNDFLGRLGFRWFAGIGFEAGEDPWCVTIQRGTRQEEFTPAEQGVLLRLRPVLSRSATLARQLSFAKVEGLSEAYDILSLAAMTFDATGRMLTMNEAAKSLCDADFGVDRLGRLAISSQAARSQIERHVAAATWRHTPADSRDLLPVVVPRQGRRPLHFQAHALKGINGSYFSPAKVMAIIRDLDATPRVPSRVLRHMFDLSPAEAALAVALDDTLDLKAAADRLEISYETARKQLAAIRGKTDTASQLELISLLRRIGR